MISRAQVRQNVLVAGAPGVTAARLIKWTAHCLARRPATVRIGDGGPLMRLAARARSHGSTSLYMKRLEYEPYLEFVSRIIRPGDCCVDVGANFGVYSLVMASRGAAVVAFEPGVAALESLRSNIALNPLANVTVMPTAVSDSDGSAELHHVGGLTTFSLGGTPETRSETVSLTTLDHALGTRRTDFIKIDVEGHEPMVLRGGRGVLGRDKPVVLFENSITALSRNGADSAESQQILEGLGYALYSYEGAKLRRVHELGNANYFAVHQESLLRERLEPFVFEHKDER